MKSFVTADKIWGNRISGKYLIYDGEHEKEGEHVILNYRHVQKLMDV